MKWFINFFFFCFFFLAVYKLSNENICDLLYELCTSKDEYVLDKVQVLLEWIEKLKLNYDCNNSGRCNNPQSGFVKCVASILWHIHEENNNINLGECITLTVFEACMFWVDRLEHEEPLKIAFDSLLCSLCYIQPKFFSQLLCTLNVNLAHLDASDVGNKMETRNDECGLTDDNKEISGTAWYNNVAKDNLTTLFRKPSYLSTIAMACQSPNAVFQLVDSGLPKLLAYAIFEFCSSLLAQENKWQTLETRHMSFKESSSQCMTDADKVAGDKMEIEANPNQSQLMTFDLVPKILDFFSECCSEGHMRDWLGTQQGCIFWKPLLKFLCNHRPANFIPSFQIRSHEPTQQAFIRIERGTINFFSRVTACHPNNQNILTTLLIEVIRESSAPILSSGMVPGTKQTISGFTRQLVLQLLLENERVLVSVHSKQSLQKKDPYSPYLPVATTLPATASLNSFTTASSVAISLVNHHPAKRVNSHHLLFSVSANTKCQEIIQNCLSGKFIDIH